MNARKTRLCATCGLSVGTYEPSVFIFADKVLHSSRAAEPGLAGVPGCRLLHRDCFNGPTPEPTPAPERHLRLVEDSETDPLTH